jgi:hypothetical protein
MKAGKYTIEIQQGATFSRIFTCRNVSKIAVNLTGYTAVISIREAVESASVIATSAGVSPTITITLGGAAGTITVDITATVTAAFDFDQAVYDIELTETSTGKVTRILEGPVILSREVTR